MQKIFGYFLFSLFLSLSLVASTYAANGIVVIQTDFGLTDGAVSEVKGVMYSVNKSLKISDLTQSIQPYNIWEASFKLAQVVPYWPKGTVFVSVVDPGVGTPRHSIVAETSDGKYIVTPDNGTLTLLQDKVGIKQVRVIDESKNRLPGSAASHTFFGRDVFGYTAAKLAAGKITFAGVGPILDEPLVRLPYQKAEIKNDSLYGALVAIDQPYGNVWTNIGKAQLDQYGVKPGKEYVVNIYHDNELKYSGRVVFHNTFGEVTQGENLMYLNSLYNLAIAINQGNFAQAHDLTSGAGWSITLRQSH